MKGQPLFGAPTYLSPSTSNHRLPRILYFLRLIWSSVFHKKAPVALPPAPAQRDPHLDDLETTLKDAGKGGPTLLLS